MTEYDAKTDPDLLTCLGQALPRVCRGRDLLGDF